MDCRISSLTDLCRVHGGHLGRTTSGRDGYPHRARDVRPLQGKDQPPESEAGNNTQPTLDFLAQAKPGMDMIIRTFDYLPGSTTGWHTHPGPVFINVISGTVTFYELDDPTCTPKVVTAGQGYVDTCHGHIGRNETGQPAKDVTISIVAVGETQLRQNTQGKYCFLNE